MEDAPQVVTVVSGYPRSGTSMMMQMLEAGGLPVLADDVHPADEYNARGYYEYGPALYPASLGLGSAWVAEARGKAVKVMAYSLQRLPCGHDYRILFMRRTVAEVVASWDKMGIVRPDCGLTAERRALALKTEYAVYEALLGLRDDFRALFLQYNDLVADPAGEAARVARFLGAPLDRKAMAAAVDPSLYHHRAG